MRCKGIILRERVTDISLERETYNSKLPPICSWFSTGYVDAPIDDFFKQLVLTLRCTTRKSIPSEIERHERLLELSRRNQFSDER